MIIFYKDKLRQVKIIGRACVKEDILRPDEHIDNGYVFLKDIETNEEFSLSVSAFEIAQKDGKKLDNSCSIMNITNQLKEVLLNVKLYIKYKLSNR